MTRIADFWANVRIGEPDECWPWTAGTDSDGYGRFGHKAKAHRVAYELTYGKLPGSRVQVRHFICDNPTCCNPRHLRSGSLQNNMQDMVDHGRSAKGEKNPEAKLDSSQVRRIRELGRFGLTAPAIASQLGLRRRTVANVLHRDTWTHLA